jgi:hypothetical protein
MDEKPSENRWKTFTEEIEIAGGNLVERVKELIAEGNVSRLRIKAADGDTFLEIPLTVGAIGGAAVTLALPWLAVLGAFAALVARARVEIVRETPADPPAPPPEPPPAG